MISSNAKTFHHLFTFNMIFELLFFSLVLLRFLSTSLNFALSMNLLLPCYCHHRCLLSHIFLFAIVVRSGSSLHSLVAVDLSIHLEQMDIGNGSTLSNRGILIAHIPFLLLQTHILTQDIRLLLLIHRDFSFRFRL